jgi:hypothetical protein
LAPCRCARQRRTQRLDAFGSVHRENFLLALQMRELRLPLLVPRLGISERDNAQRPQQFGLLRLGAGQVGAQRREVRHAGHDPQLAESG